MKHIYAILSMTMLCLQLSAQTVSEARTIRTSALMVYDSYVGMMNRLNNGSLTNEVDFVKLFVPGTDSIYNDIMTDSEEKWLTPEAYFSLYASTVKKSGYSFANLSMGTPTEGGDKWTIDLHFSRDVEFPDSVIELPSWRFHYDMQIVMDKELTMDKVFANARISKIAVTGSPEDVIVIVNPQRIPLRFQNRPVGKYDTSCDCIVVDLDGEKPSSIKWDINNSFQPVQVERNGNVYKYSRSSCNIWGVSVGVAPYRIGNKVTLANSGIGNSGSSTRFGGFFGKNMISSDRHAGFLNVGIDLSNSNLSYTSNKPYSYSFAAVDDDGDSYTRNVSVDIKHEKWSITSFVLPVSFSYLINLTPDSERHIYLSAEAGVFVALRAFYSLYYNVNATYTGTYSQYWDVEMDHYYDYGKYQLSGSTASTYSDSFMRFNFGAQLGAGICLQLGNLSFLRFDFTARKNFLREMKGYTDERITTHSPEYNPVLGFANSALDPYLGLTFILLQPINK